jgi:hypothetical protein
VSWCLRRRAETHPARAACRLALDAVSIPARPPSAPNNPVSGRAHDRRRRAARLAGAAACGRYIIYGALPLGELSRAFLFFLKDAGYMTSESDEAKVRTVDGLDGVQARLLQAVQPHHVVIKAAFAVPVLVVSAMPFSPPLCPARRCPGTSCPTPRPGRQMLLLRRRTTGRCSPRVGNDVGNLRTYSTFISAAILAMSYRRQYFPSSWRRRANLDAATSVREWYRDWVRFHSLYQRQRLLIFHSPRRLRSAKRTCP